MTLLNKRDVIRIEKGHRIYADVPEHFAYDNRRGVFDMTHADVEVFGQLLYLAGLYIVTHTSPDGGHGHEYANGHHVYCVSENGEREIDFYQTGGFTAMILEDDIEAIAVAECKWVIPEGIK